MKKEKNDKPLIITIEETRKEIISSINDIVKRKGLSYYFLDIILEPISFEVREKKNQEIAMITENYYKILKSDERKENEK